VRALITKNCIEKYLNISLKVIKVEIEEGIITFNTYDSSGSYTKSKKHTISVEEFEKIRYPVFNKICKFCENEFTTEIKSKIFCTKKCNAAFHRKARIKIRTEPRILQSELNKEIAECDIDCFLKGIDEYN